jgi:Zinc carboxypeptidase
VPYPSTVQEIERRIANLASDFKTTAKQEQLDHRTHESGTAVGLAGRLVHFLRIGTGVGEGRPRVLLVGGVHAREWAPPDALLTFLEKLLAAYATKSTTKRDMVFGAVDDTRKKPTIPYKEFTIPFADVERIVEQVELYVIPLVNPDGRAHTMAPKKVKGWRKNRRPAPPNTTCPPLPPGLSPDDLVVLSNDPAGVDLNRNFDIAWDINEYYSVAAVGSVGVSEDPCDFPQTFHGPPPQSGKPREEPETLNVQELITKRRIQFYIDLHSFARRFLFAWGMEQNQQTGPARTFKNTSFDRKPPNPSGKGGRDGTGETYKEWMPPGIEAEHIRLGDRMAKAVLDSTGFTEGQAAKDPIAAAARTNSLHKTIQSTALSGLITGVSRDFAFAQQIGGTRGKDVRAVALDPVFSFTFECGHDDDGGFWPAALIEYPKIEREVAAALAEFLRFAISRRAAQTSTTIAPTRPPTPKPPGRKRKHRTSAHEFQSTGILLAGTGEHEVRVLGALREVPPPLPPPMKEELTTSGDLSLYERYFAGELAGTQEDPEVQPFHPRVPALFVTGGGEPLFLERDWSGVEITLADFPLLPDAAPDAPTDAPPAPAPKPPVPAPSVVPPAMAVPLFRPKVADPLDPNAKFQAALDAAITALETRRSLSAGTMPIPIALAEVTDTSGTFPFAGYRADEVDYIASEAKVAVMYAAFALKDMAQRFADAQTIPPADLFTRLVADMNPTIRAVVPAIASATNLNDMQREPGYKRKRVHANDVDMLTAAPKAVGGSTVSFTTNFQSALEAMIIPSSNQGAARCVHAVGYGYLNGALEAGGFFDSTLAPTPGHGLWVAGDFQEAKDWPYVRVNSANDAGVAQAGTARQMVKLVSLIFAKRLLDTAACDAMFDLLHKAALGVPRQRTVAHPVDEPFVGRATAGILRAGSITHNKLGLGPLKRAGMEVASEVTVLAAPVAPDRTYVVAWQNLEWPLAADDPTPITFTDVATLIRDTIKEFEKPVLPPPSPGPTP